MGGMRRGGARSRGLLAVTPGRVVGLLVLLVLAVVVYAGWVAWQVRGDLTDAQRSIRTLNTSIDSGNADDRDAALDDLRASAASADDHASSWTWSVAARLPWIGDDVQGVRALTGALLVVSDDGVEPLLPLVDEADRLIRDGRIDLDRVRSAQRPLAQSADAFERASNELDSVDPAGLVGILGTRFAQVDSQLASATSGLHAASEAAQLLPSMAGGDGPRDYLLIFQNNAEIRATGGLPGSWARIHADDGRLSMREQGTAGDFPQLDEPVLPLAPVEEAVYGEGIGTFFQNPGFAPDFPRAAQLWDAHWDRRTPGIPLDGVLAMDPVALSYLMEGTGPVRVGDTTLTADNLVQILLNQTYIDLEPEEQDAFFQESARTIFEAVTGAPRSPVAFLRGLQTASDEGRFLVAPFEQTERERLEGTEVEGALAGADGATPHVDVGLNDNTASKLSYYLRYDTDVDAVSCVDSRQQLNATMTLRQAIAPADAAKLPDSVTGSQPTGPQVGQQQVAVRLYGPVDGTIEDVTLDGEAVADQLPVVTDENGRSIVTLTVAPDSRDDVTLSWSMTTGPGQVDDGEVGVTPGVLPGQADSEFASAC